MTETQLNQLADMWEVYQARYNLAHAAARIARINHNKRLYVQARREMSTCRAVLEMLENASTVKQAGNR